MRVSLVVLVASLATGCTEDPPDDIAVDLPGGVSVVELALVEGSNPAPHTVTLTNNGTTAMTVAISNYESAGGDWLSTSLASLNVPAQQSATFDLLFSVSALPPGLYTATVRLDAVATATGRRAVGSPRAFGVNVIITRNVAVLDTPTSGVGIDLATPVGFAPVSAVGAPTARVEHTLTWVGGEFLVFGGWDSLMSGPAANGGAFYDPDGDSWRPMSDATGGDQRAGHATLWDRANNRVVIYGGVYESGTFMSDSSVVMTYSLDPDATAPWGTSPYISGGPDPRSHHAMVDAGSQWIAWGGTVPPTGVTNTGWRCGFSAGACSATSTSGAPSARYAPLAAWTGKELIVFGGRDLSGGPLSDGGLYDPATDSWRSMSAAGAPTTNPGPYGGCWTGKELVVFGGEWWNAGSPAGSNHTWRYDPVSNVWRTLDVGAANTPTARRWHTTIWTGSRVVVWGGYDDAGAAVLSSGGQLDPGLGAWFTMPYNNEPTSRRMHTAAWSGSAMFIWGGDSGGEFLSDGALLK